jgi:hypothetical protein
MLGVMEHYDLIPVDSPPGLAASDTAEPRHLVNAGGEQYRVRWDAASLGGVTSGSIVCETCPHDCRQPRLAAEEATV